LPFNALFGFVPLPASMVLGMIGLTLAYIVAVELAKKIFYARQSLQRKPETIDAV
jgi:Mg2+-importing ATPase